jgi:leucyl/phenylalanyl-tRNA--protein transferase
MISDADVAWNWTQAPMTRTNLSIAYRHGIFPWPMSQDPQEPLLWFSPRQRAILEMDHLHLSRSLKKAQRQYSSYLLTLNADFPAVIQACTHVKRDETWITPDMIVAYTDCSLHPVTHPYPLQTLSFELWEPHSPQPQLVAGLYGVLTQHYFSAESMFHLKSNASKVLILRALDYLQQHYQFNWIDIQTLSPHLESMGARDIPREEFLRRILPSG